MKRRACVAVCAGLLAIVVAARADEVEVLHWWTSGGEAKSVAELKKMIEAKGHRWKDFAVVGGGGHNAMKALKARADVGDAPTAAQMQGPTIQLWGDAGVLADLDSVAKAGGWDTALPAVVSAQMKYKGHYVAAPVNVHRVNWMWVNLEVFYRAGAAVPKTWEEFAVEAEKIQKAGFIPVAHGGEPWQDFTVFESVVLGVGGPDFYKEVFVDLDPVALKSATMEQAFATLRLVQKFTDKDVANRSWDRATAMVIEGKAAMQFMGDWAKGEFAVKGKRAGKEYICAPAPGTANAYTYNVDSFVMFRQKSPARRRAQADLAAAIMSPAFQKVFNLNKGSIPARLDIDMTPFDYCGKLSSRDFVGASKANTLLPSVAHGMALPPATAEAMRDTVSHFMATPSMSTRQAVNAFYAASLVERGSI
jgi:glucose/mannose transport system substrate-binding protein